jgi:hypothetical protein
VWIAVVENPKTRLLLLESDIPRIDLRQRCLEVYRSSEVRRLGTAARTDGLLREVRCWPRTIGALLSAPRTNRFI